MKNRRPKGEALKEGLYYIKNYDGSFVNDPNDPRDAMTPDGMIDGEEIDYWPQHTYNFLIHEDGTMDICLYWCANYSGYLRQAAWEIYMTFSRNRITRREVWWFMRNNPELIATNSGKPLHQRMIAEMLRFDGITIDQFAELKEQEERILKTERIKIKI